MKAKTKQEVIVEWMREKYVTKYLYIYLSISRTYLECILKAVTDFSWYILNLLIFAERKKERNNQIWRANEKAKNNQKEIMVSLLFSTLHEILGGRNVHSLTGPVLNICHFHRKLMASIFWFYLLTYINRLILTS